MAPAVPGTGDTSVMVLQSLNDLEFRLRRLEFFLGPPLPADSTPPHEMRRGPRHTATSTAAAATEQAPVRTRLAELEQRLQDLARENGAVGDLLQLLSRHAYLFPSSHTTTSPSIDDTAASSTDDTTAPSGTPDAATLAHYKTQVLASAPLFPSTSSQLLTLRDTPIPPAHASTSLVLLSPRMVRCGERQQDQQRAVAELVRRSAQLVQRWMEVGVLGVGECMAEWEARMGAAEKQVRRSERAREESEK